MNPKTTKQYKTAIKNWPKDDRPREKLLRNGEHTLSNTELLAILYHPSGDPTPSREDKEFTQELTEAGKTLQINVLDHIIIGDNKYFSFADEGMI